MTPEEERSADLLDVALRDEIELVGDLVVAASGSPRHFTPDEVDALLGVPGEGTGASVDPSVNAVVGSVAGSADETPDGAASAP